MKDKNSDEEHNTPKLNDPADPNILQESLRQGAQADPNWRKVYNSFSNYVGNSDTTDPMGQSVNATRDWMTEAQPDENSSLAECLNIANDFVEADGSPTLQAREYMKEHIRSIEMKESQVTDQTVTGNDVHDVIRQRYNIKPEDTDFNKKKVKARVQLKGKDEPETIVLTAEELKRITLKDQYVKLYRRAAEDLKRRFKREPTMNEVALAIIKLQSPTQDIFFQLINKYRKQMEDQGFKFDENGNPIITDAIREEHDRIFGELMMNGDIPSNDPEIPNNIEEDDDEDF